MDSTILNKEACSAWWVYQLCILWDKRVDKLSLSSHKQVYQNILIMVISQFGLPHFGFYLIWSQYLQLLVTFHPIRFPGCKQGLQVNWQETSVGAENDMLWGILEDVKAEGFNIM